MTIIVKSKIKLPNNKKYQTGRLKALFNKTNKRAAAINAALPKINRKFALNGRIGARVEHTPLYTASLGSSARPSLDAVDQQIAAVDRLLEKQAPWLTTEHLDKIHGPGIRVDTLNF
jgi:hypothetical protein